MATSRSAFEEALGFLNTTFKGAKSAISSGVSNFAQDFSNWKKKSDDEQKRKQQKVNSFLSDAKNYFNPDKAAGGSNFWKTPVAQGLANVQTSLTQSRPVQDISRAGQAISQNTRDFTNILKTTPRQYLNPDEAASGPNFWTTRPAKDLAKIQAQPFPQLIQRRMPDVAYLDEAIVPSLKSTLAMLNQQGVDIMRGEGIIGKIGYLATGQYLLPDSYREKVTAKAEDFNKNLLASAQKDQQELETYLRENPLDVDVNGLPFLQKIKDPDFVTRGLLLNIPSLAISLGSTFLTFMATKNPALASQVAFGTAFSMEAGNAYLDALKEGVDEKTARTKGFVVGAINGFLERMFPASKLDDMLSPKIKSSLFRNIGKFVQDAILEGSTESLQEIVSNAARSTYDENYRGTGLLSGTPESFFFGTLLGIGGNVITAPLSGSGITDVNIQTPSADVPITEEPEPSPLEELFRIERGPVSPEIQQPIGYGIQMVSPSVKSGMTVEEATQEMSGERHIQMRNAFNDIDTRLGIQNNVFDALGDTREWGTENSLFNVIPQATTYEQIRLSAAFKGLVAEQMAVIPFQVSPEGKSKIYLTKITKDDINTVRENLDIAGLDYRTIIDQGDHYLIAVFDEHDTLNSNVGRFADYYSQYEGEPIRPTTFTGRGEILGGDTREQGAEAYKRAIRETTDWENAVRRFDGTSYGTRISDILNQPSSEGSYRIQVEEAPYNITADEAQEKLNQFFDENEVAFLTKDPGTIVTSTGEVAVGRYTSALIEAVEQNGQVQDQTVYHEAFHAYVDMFADEKLHQQALKQIKEELAIKEDAAGEEALAEGFASWMQNKQTGFTGKIQNFFDWLFNNLKGLIGRKNQIEGIYQEMLAKKRARGIKSGQIALSYRDAQGVSVNGVHQPNLTSKIIQTLINETKGGEEGVTSLQHIENLTNRGGLKQVERDMAREIANRLAGPDGRVNVAEFVDAYKKGLLPLQAGTETSWENIVLPDEVRGDVSNYYERIYSSPFETTLGKHFRDFPNYFAHVRVEDMGDTERTFDEINRSVETGGTRRLIEIQSDMFQIPTEDFERQFASPEPINKLVTIVNDERSAALDDFTGTKRTGEERIKRIFSEIPSIIKETGLDKRYSGKINGFVEENQRRIEHVESQLEEYRNNLSALSQGERDELAINDVNARIKSDEEWIKELKATNEFYSRLLKRLPDPPVGAQTMDKLLRPYKNVWFERIFKEEIARAAADGKDQIQVPTGETIARIEGYVGSGVVPQDSSVGDSFEYGGTEYLILEDYGETVMAVDEYEVENRFDWERAVQEEIDNDVADRIDYEFNHLSADSVVDFDLDQMINHVLSVDEMNKYKENPVEYIKNNREDLTNKLRDEIQTEIEARYPSAEAFAEYWTDSTGQKYYAVGDEIVVLKKDAYTEELSKGTPEDFDIEQLSDDQKTIYNRYENEYPKYLKKLRPDLKEVTDENGITWWETKITEKDKANIEAFRVEKKNQAPKVEESIENTEDFFLAMKNLKTFRNYHAEMFSFSAEMTDEEMNMETLAKYRGYQSIPAEVVQNIAPEAMDRINHLNDVRSEFISQIGNIEDVSKNYDFYTKRFGKLMYRKELASLKTELKSLVKGIDKEIKQLQKQTINTEVPAPSNQELAMQALEQSRNTGQVPPAETAPVAPEELAPAAPPPQQPNEPTGPEGFDENAQKDIETAFRNKARIEGLPDLTGRTDKDKFNTILSWMIGQHDVAKITGTEIGEQLVDIPRDRGIETIRAIEAGGSEDPQIDEYAKRIRVLYDQLYEVAKGVPEIDMGYIENYITHIWKGKMEDTANAYRQWKTKFGYANQRVIPNIDDGLAMGLELKYDHPAPIIAQYTAKLYQTIANIEAFKAMREEGLLLPYPQARKIPGYVPVVAPGIRRSYSVDTTTGDKRTVAGDYYAPREIANVLNRVFSPQDSLGFTEKGLSVLAKISSAMQDIGLSGGVPYTPLNAWTIGQFYREMATNIGGMVTSPLYSIKRMGSLVGSTLRPLIPGASGKFFKDNSGQIKKMVARNIPLTTTYTIDDLMGSSFKDKFIGGGIKGTWNKAIFDATFRKFMPMLQISMFNQVESAALKSGYTPEQSADVAANAVKKFYGIVGTKDKLLRGQVVNDALTTFFFAPRYRETMARAWLNTLTAVLPVKVENGKVGFNNPFSLENKTNTNLLFGTILTIVAYNILNYALTGRRLKDNPPGTEDKLLIPLSDGYTVGIPLFPSTGTVVRYGAGFFKNLVSGDTKGMINQGKNLLSFMIRPALDALTNEDYYGRQIYADTDSPDVRWKKIGSYIALQYNHPWIEAFVNQKGGWFLGKEYEKKPGYQNMLEAFEAPTRFYKSDSLASRYFYENLRQVRGTLSAEDQKIWDKLHSQGGYFFDVEDGLPVYDKRNAMANALDRLSHPEVVRAETEAAIKTAQEQGTPLSPFYVLDKEHQFVVLLLKTFYPGEETYKQIRDENIEWLQPYWDKTKEWSNQMVKLGIFEDKAGDEITQSRKQAVLGLYLQGVRDAKEISTLLNESATKQGYKSGDWSPEEVNKYITSSNFIEVTPELQVKLDYFNTLPQGTGARSRYIRANPDLKAYFDATTEQKNLSRWELGLPPIGGYSGGGGYGDYTPKIKLKIPDLSKTALKLNIAGYKPSGISIKNTSFEVPTMPIKARSLNSTSGYRVPNISPIAVKNLVPLNLSQIGR